MTHIRNRGNYHGASTQRRFATPASSGRSFDDPVGDYFRFAGSGRPGPSKPPEDLYLFALVYLLPGILYVLFAIFLRQRHSWAVTASLVLVAVHELMAIAGLVMVAVGGEMPNWVLIIIVIWILALAQLLFHLSKSFASICAYQELVPRGFEPLPPTNLQPPMK